MKKIATSSPFTWKMVDVRRGRFIRTYRRSKGLHAYLRSIPLDKTIKLLESSNIKHPRLLRNRWRYVDIQYIEGKPLQDTSDNKVLINVFSNAIFEMKKINPRPIRKYIKWKDNTGFFRYMCDNMIDVMKKYDDNRIMLAKIGVRRRAFDNFKKVLLDNNRPLTFIHGDLHPNNVIVHNNEYYIIDWELATYGDLAYELAMHFFLVPYSEEQKDIILTRISQSFGVNKINLINDIAIYTDFEGTRRAFLRMNRAISLARDGKPYEKLLMEGFRYYRNLGVSLTLDQIRARFKELTR